MMQLRKIFRSAGMRLAHTFGTNLKDAETGEVLGRVLIIPWGGKLHVIGLEETWVRPVFIPQKRLTYWKQELGFTTHPAPDFPREARETRDRGDILNQFAPRRSESGQRGRETPERGIHPDPAAVVLRANRT